MPFSENDYDKMKRKREQEKDPAGQKSNHKRVHLLSPLYAIFDKATEYFWPESQQKELPTEDEFSDCEEECIPSIVPVSPHVYDETAWGWQEDTLPEEILFKIFQDSVDPSDRTVVLTVCRFVCRQWRRIIPPIIAPTPDLSSLSTNYQQTLGAQLRSINFARECISSPWLKINHIILLLNWARGQGCPWVKDTNICCAAAQRGDLSLLAWLREEGCPLQFSLVAIAAAGQGHTHILRWLERKEKEKESDNEKEKEKESDTDSESEKLKQNYLLCSSAAMGGHIETLQFLKERKERMLPYFPSFYLSVAAAAAQCGHIHVLEWILSIHNEPIDSYDHRQLVGRIQHSALSYSQWEALLWILERHADGGWMQTSFGMNAWLSKAIKAGHLGLMKHAKKVSLPQHWISYVSPIIWREAALHNHLHILRWLREEQEREGVMTWHPTFMHDAVRGGETSVLVWAMKECGCRWQPGTLLAAAENSQGELVRWLYNEGYPPFYQREEMRSVVISLIGKGNVDILDWLFERGKREEEKEDDGDGYVRIQSILSSTPLLYRYAQEEMVLSWLVDHGCPWDTGLCLFYCRAIKHQLQESEEAFDQEEEGEEVDIEPEDQQQRDHEEGYGMYSHLEVFPLLRWVMDRGLSSLPEGRLCSFLAQEGYLGLLRIAMETGSYSYWEGGEGCVTLRLARRGHMKMLRWVVEEMGAPVGERTTAALAQGGHITTLLWIIERVRGVPLGREVSHALSQWGDEDILLFAILHGCTYDPSTRVAIPIQDWLNLLQNVVK